MFPLRRVGRGGVSADAGFVPVAGGGAGGGGDRCLQWAAAGGEGDRLVVCVEADFADAVELAQGSGGGEVLAGQVGVCDVGGLQVEVFLSLRDSSPVFSSRIGGRAVVVVWSW